MLNIFSQSHAVAAPKTSASTSSLLLTQNGKSSYVIALASDAIPAERTAATQLQNYLKQVTGAQLPIKNESSVGESAPQILVGAGKRAKRLVPSQNWKALGLDGILLKTQGKNLILAGSRPRGTLYAVNDFLENSVGIRWWTSKESYVPRTPTLKIAAQNKVYTPPFGYREHFTTDISDDAPFATRMRENGHFQPQNADWGGHYNLLGWCHTFEKLLPVETYFESHPEWYSDLDNGNKPCTSKSRRPVVWQPDLSNEAARRELTKNALNWIRENPHAGIISISQNDNNNYCQSAGDLALIEREGSPSGPLLHFINQVAADIHKEFPEFLVETLAYSYTRQAPRTIKPAANVIVRLCVIEGDFARPLNSQANVSFHNDLLAWEKIAPQLYIWNYVTNFNYVIWPHPNLRVLAPDLRFFAKHKVFGVFEQGDKYSNGVGDFVQMRTWLLGKLMWNPQLDDNKLINEFLVGYYGPAAPHLRQYLDLINTSFLKANIPLTVASGNFDYLTLDVVSRAREHFAAAEKAVANNPERVRRVRRERLALDNVVITLYNRLAGESPTAAALLPTDMKAFTEDFIATARANNVRGISETQQFDNYATALMARYESRSPLPEPLRGQIAESELQTRVIDIQENAFRFYFQPDQSDSVVDPLASNGKAARVSGRSRDWVLQSDIRMDEKLLEAKPWRIYAVVRVEAPSDAVLDARAFSIGINNQTTMKSDFEASHHLRDLRDGAYHLVELGVAQLKGNSYVYVLPPDRADITNVFFDRILLIQEK